MAITQDQLKRRQALENRDSYATVLLAVLIDAFGTEFFEWEPETLRMEVSDNFQAKVPEANWGKIWSLIVALTTNQFYVSTEVYRATCEALSGGNPDFSMFSPSDPEELAWGVTEVVLNDPPDKEPGNNDFSSEVCTYTGLILEQNGIYKPPAPLIFARYPRGNPIMDQETMFSNDPAMFAASYQNQQTLKENIENFVRARAAELQAQLDAVPLNNRVK